MKHRTPAPLQQKGSMMIEALLAILLFSLGAIAMMGLQAASVTMSTDAKYRSDANLLANNLIAQMWVNHQSTALQANFQTGGTAYKAWLTDVDAALPGATASPPTVSFSTPASGGGSLVKVVIFWKSSDEATVHTYTAIAQII